MKESLLTDVFLNAGFFLVLSAVVIPVLRYFKIPIALGYLLAGLAIGPYALGALTESYPVLNAVSLKDAEHVKILAELGIVLLLFIVGLELTPKLLWQMRSLVFGLGGFQVLVSAAVIGGISFLWGNTIQVSVLLGLGLALSSTAIVIQWLHEKKLFATNMGRSSFSILLLQDLAVIPILLLLTIMSTDIEGPIAQFVSISLLKMVGTALAIYFGGRIILKPLFVFANRHGGAEVFMALSLLIIVASASIADMAGLSMALGAFIAGLLIADTEYRHEISALILPFKSILLGIFFFSFGMSIDLHFILEKPVWLIASVFGLLAIKATIIFILCKIWKQSTAVSAESAILLAQAGEFGLLVVGTALTVGLMDDYVGQFMLIMVGITMMLTPLLAPLARYVGHTIEERSICEAEKNQDPATANIQGENHVAIFGYGRIGREVAKVLSQEGLEVIAFDKNTDNVQKGRDDGVQVFFGDASRDHALSSAGIDKALCAVVALDDVSATRRMVDMIRETDLTLPVIVRAQCEEDLEKFNEVDNIEAIPEYHHISVKITESIIDYFRPSCLESAEEEAERKSQKEAAE